MLTRCRTTLWEHFVPWCVVAVGSCSLLVVECAVGVPVALVFPLLVRLGVSGGSLRVLAMGEDACL